MIVAVDVHYRGDDTARAAAVGFDAWTDASAAREATVEIARVAPYEPGAFFRRELPCIRAVLEKIDARVIVIDGYVDLDDDRPGLGRKLYDELGGGVSVVGVAKSRFAGARAFEVKRGQSDARLFVTAAGMPVEEAARAIANMHGPHRMPTLLSRVDALARGR